MIKIGGIEIAFISHTSFLFRTHESRIVLTDPYFSGGFVRQGRYEQHFQRPDIRAQSISRCDVVFVSHNHGDHFDPEGIGIIVGNTGARVFGPHEVLDSLAVSGLPRDLLHEATEGSPLVIGDLRLSALGNYDDVVDGNGRTSKGSADGL